MTKFQKLADRYTKITGKPAPRGTSTTALQVLVNQLENEFWFERFHASLQARNVK